LIPTLLLLHLGPLVFRSARAAAAAARIGRGDACAREEAAPTEQRIMVVETGFFFPTLSTRKKWDRALSTPFKLFLGDGNPLSAAKKTLEENTCREMTSVSELSYRSLQSELKTLGESARG
jgi:hypothetical protein